MPFYQYKCSDCGVEIDIFHIMQETYEDTSCEKCTGGYLKRQISFFNTGGLEKEIPTKVGDVVKEFIKNSKKDVNVEKKKMIKERK